MGPHLLARDGIGADCSTPLAGVREAPEQSVEFEQGRQRDVRDLDERQARAALPLRHPFRDDDRASLGSQADERPLACTGDVYPRRSERLATERMPRIMDGDRS